MKILKKIATALLVAFVVAQFFRPTQNKSLGNHTKVFIAETNPPEKVRVVLEQTCYDCHSDNTNYPWYNNIAPVSFWLSKHVRDGKKHLNFSDWATYSDKEKDHKLEEVVETLDNGEMPLKEYTWTHEQAKLTENQKILIKEWVLHSRALYQLKNLRQ